MEDRRRTCFPGPNGLDSGAIGNATCRGGWTRWHLFIRIIDMLELLEL